MSVIINIIVETAGRQRQAYGALCLRVAAGYEFLQVKTVRMGMYDDYDATNRFYISLGFKEFEVLPQIWDEANPCQIYVMGLK